MTDFWIFIIWLLPTTIVFLAIAKALIWWNYG